MLGKELQTFAETHRLPKQESPVPCWTSHQTAPPSCERILHPRRGRFEIRQRAWRSISYPAEERIPRVASPQYQGGIVRAIAIRREHGSKPNCPHRRVA